MPPPICFMIMPYGTKATQADPSVGVANIDFNALWDRAYAPVIEGLGYKPIRADQDTNALILSDMIRRLFFSDLVLADMTAPNGNVYDEVGVRHAAKRDGCVLLAADWSKPLFDLAQIRTIRYPLKEGAINDFTATAISAAIKSPIEAFRRGDSPVFGSIRGYPTDVDPSETATMKATMLGLSAFQGQIRAVRAMPQAKRMQRAKQLLRETSTGPSSDRASSLSSRALRPSSCDTHCCCRLPSMVKTMGQNPATLCAWSSSSATSSPNSSFCQPYLYGWLITHSSKPSRCTTGSGTSFDARAFRLPGASGARLFRP